MLEDIRTLTDAIDGWLGKREGPYLYSLATIGAQLGVVVEIGSWKGKSTVWLAKGSEAVGGGPVYAIDPHVGGPDQEKLGYRDIDTEKEFKKNIALAGVKSTVVPMVMPSMQALENWNEGIGLLWIDGDHSYEGASKDFHGWCGYVCDGGVIALHDTYSWDGVRKLVDEEILRSKQYRVLGQMDSILAVQKTDVVTKMDRAKIELILYLRRIYNEARLKRKHWRALPRKLLRGLSTPKGGGRGQRIGLQR